PRGPDQETGAAGVVVAGGVHLDEDGGRLQPLQHLDRDGRRPRRLGPWLRRLKGLDRRGRPAGRGIFTPVGPRRGGGPHARALHRGLLGGLLRRLLRRLLGRVDQFLLDRGRGLVGGLGDRALVGRFGAEEGDGHKRRQAAAAEDQQRQAAHDKADDQRQAALR